MAASTEPLQVVIDGFGTLTLNHSIEVQIQTHEITIELHVTPEEFDNDRRTAQYVVDAASGVTQVTYASVRSAQCVAVKFRPSSLEHNEDIAIGASMLLKELTNVIERRLPHLPVRPRQERDIVAARPGSPLARDYPAKPSKRR